MNACRPVRSRAGYCIGLDRTLNGEQHRPRSGVHFYGAADAFSVLSTLKHNANRRVIEEGTRRWAEYTRQRDGGQWEPAEPRWTTKNRTREGSIHSFTLVIKPCYRWVRA